MIRRPLSAIVCAAMVVAVPASAKASAREPARAREQQAVASATVTGTVRDQSDAVVPGVRVRLRKQTGDDRNNDTTANDRPAGVGRNSARLPDTSSFDVRVSRSFAIGGTHRLLALVEAFNLCNHVNILNVNNTFGSGTTPRPSFGQPTLAGDPRQIQIGIRWSFQ